ncbi:MAG: sugar transferase [Planctomycetes bacterium]|nr:sugar transferase [Planctomycetota bacterium]
MKGRAPLILFALAETILLLLVVTPVAHIRSLAEWMLVTSTDHLPQVAADETTFIVMRTLVMVLALQVSFAFRDLYRWSVIVRPQLVIERLIEGVIAVLVALPLLHYVMGVADRQFELDGTLLRLQIHPLLVVAGSGAAFLASYGLRMQFPRWFQGAGLAERIALVGHGPMIDILEEEIRRRADPAIDFVGVLDDGEHPPAGRAVIGPPSHAHEIVAEHEIQRLVVSRHSRLANDMILRLRMGGVNIVNTASFYERLTGRISPESLSEPDLFLTSSAPNRFSRALKRGLDIVLALVGLLLALPIFVVVSLLVKLESRGPVFYSQERVGANGHTFELSKFRSMRADAETRSGPVWASRNDPRITRVGRWLRKLRVDEIPQLWAVLCNDMSFVGPRPERPVFVEELEAKIPHYGRRHLVKPGVTGWAQINYSYGNTVDDAFIKLQFDLYYIKHRSLALDIAIVLRTIKVVVLQQGAV